MPFFVVGSERSGTTLLRLMLSHHPQIAVCSEFEYAVAHLGSEGERPHAQAFREILGCDRMFRSHGFDIDASLGYDELVRSFLKQQAEREDKAIVGAVVHFAFERLPFLWPDAKHIHLIRDGRDVARSCMQMGWAGNVWTGAERWMTAEASWDALCARTRGEQRLEVRLESLARDPGGTLDRICAFLGVKYDARMLMYHENSTYDAPDARLTGQWRTKMSQDEVRLVEARIGGMLLRRGYALSGLPCMRVTKAMKRRLRRQDRRSRTRFRLRRFGFRLWAADVVLRRLGWSSLHRKVQLRKNQIQDAYIK